MVILDKSTRTWYIFYDFQLSNDDLTQDMLKIYKLKIHIAGPMFDWHSRLTNIVVNDSPRGLGFSKTGRGYAMKVAGGDGRTDRCL